MKIVRAIRNGWIKPPDKEASKTRYYDLWAADDQVRCYSKDNTTCTLTLYVHMHIHATHQNYNRVHVLDISVKLTTWQ